MKPNSSKYFEKYQKLIDLPCGDQRVYFVGGIVRDFVAGRENKDIDILCEKDTISVARQWAALNKGAFYVMDAERGTTRVITGTNSGKLVFDFARQQGGSLLNDLSARDFTINAMAVDFKDLDSIIDPFNGQDDLNKRVLNCCSDTSFANDPVRVIRAFRYAAAYDLTLSERALSALRNSTAGLNSISGERKRDEFFKILDLPDPSAVLKQLQEEHVLQQLGFSPVSVERFDFLESFIELLSNILGNGQAQSSLAENKQFGRIEYRSHLMQKNTSDRNARQLLILYTLIMGQGGDLAAKVSLQSFLSNDESQYLTALIQNQAVIEKLFSKDKAIDNREYFSYFSRTDIAGLDLCLIEIAKEKHPEKQILKKQKAGLFFEAWFEHPEVVRPTPYLSGKELMMNFDLTPGPIIGKLLSQLKEEQAAGTINTRQQAFEWLDQQISTIKNQLYWDQQD